jgi:glycerophosphodiester phosphodiesterase
MLSLKQSNYPVFMLTESGWVEYNDPRTNSLHEAVRFARQYDLMGMVSMATAVLAGGRVDILLAWTVQGGQKGYVLIVY